MKDLFWAMGDKLSLEVVVRFERLEEEKNIYTKPCLEITLRGKVSLSSYVHFKDADQEG